MAKTKKSGKKASKGLNLDLKNKDYNLVKIKSTSLNIISITIIIEILLILLLGYIIYYLNNLKNCNCFIENNEENKANVDYLIIIESIGIAVNIIILLRSISLYMDINKIKSGGGNVNAILTYSIAALINLLVYGFFVYNVFLLSKNIDPTCECTQNPIRYILYLQAIFTSISILVSIIGIFYIVKK